MVFQWTAISALTFMVVTAPAAAPAGTAAGTHARRMASTRETAVTIKSRPVTLTTSTGRRLRVDVVASGEPGGPDYVLVDAGVDSRPYAIGRTESWEFRLSGSSVGYRSRTGDGRIDAGEYEIGPYGHIALSFTPRSTRSLSCTSGSETRETGTLRGALILDTRTQLLGEFGRSLDFRHATLSLDHGCQQRAQPAPCGGGLNWSDSDFSSSGPLLRSVFGGRDEGIPGWWVGAERGVHLKTRHGGTRIDWLLSHAARGHFRASSGVVEDHVAGGEIAGGPVTVRGDVDPTRQTANCGGGKRRIRMISWPSGRLELSHLLHFHFAAGSPMTVRPVDSTSDAVTVYYQSNG